ncbi:MAG: hypothetical protein ACYDDV_04070 [Methanoregula sp.]
MILAAGCSISINPINQPVPEPTQATALPPPAPVPSVPLKDIPVIAPSPTVMPAFSSKDTNTNFLNIAFGDGPPYLIKWDNPVVKIGISGSYRDADYTIIEDLIQDFNKRSSTTHATLYRDENQPVTIILVPESFLDQVTTDHNTLHPTDIILRSNLTGQVLLIRKPVLDQAIYKERIYVNADSGEFRNYSIMRGVLLGLGFPGYSEYRDSIFYPETDTLATLSPGDWRAVEMMYNMDFKRNDTKSQVKFKMNE